MESAIIILVSCVSDPMVTLGMECAIIILVFYVSVESAIIVLV